MQVRKKLDILEAFRFGIDAMPEWFQDKIINNEAFDNGDTCQIRTVVNHEYIWMECKFGYVVVKDVGGVVYPVEPAVFGLMFEVVRR